MAGIPSTAWMLGGAILPIRPRQTMCRFARSGAHAGCIGPPAAAVSDWAGETTQ
jgi:hypothetical protein